MRTKSFLVRRLWVDGAEVAVGYTDLDVHQDDLTGGDPAPLGWEIGSNSVGEIALDLAPHEVEVETTDDRRFGGTAHLVHTDGRQHFFSGAGPLNGFGTGDFD